MLQNSVHKILISYKRKAAVHIHSNLIKKIFFVYYELNIMIIIIHIHRIYMYIMWILTKQWLCEVLVNIDWTLGFSCWYNPTVITSVYSPVYCLRHTYNVTMYTQYIMRAMQIRAMMVVRLFTLAFEEIKARISFQEEPFSEYTTRAIQSKRSGHYGMLGRWKHIHNFKFCIVLVTDKLSFPFAQ